MIRTTLLPVIIVLFAMITEPVTAQSLSERVVHNNPDEQRVLSSVHDGAGQMAFTGLIGSQDLATNFLYLHAGKIHPKGGIGHHFHHKIEEMYVLLNGEAEFTINGHTSRLQAPVVVPNKMGDSHALYNPTDDTLRWLNFAVSSKKGEGDAFDLGDDRVDAELDPTPVFVSGQLNQTELRADNHPYSGNGVRYRRVLGPKIFSTQWNHVDHMVIPAGSSAGPHQLKGNEEVYYVINGSGSITVNNETAAIEADDAFTGLLGETITISSNEGSDDLELLVIGISASQKEPAISEPPAEPKAMVLQMDFVVPEENRKAFEEMYYSIYVPAMKVQDGYLSSKLLRLYPDKLASEIEAEPTNYNYQIQISFDTEDNRQRWVKSDQHQIAWPAATDLATEFKWRGYHVMGDDDNQ